MAVEVALIVTDAPPLITLAAAESLDYLLYPELPVIIPDAVFHEATSSASKLGAQEILDWYRAHTAQVRVEPTSAFREEAFLRASIQGRRPARDVGERAALEVIRSYPMSQDARALLLSDDRDAQRLLVFEPDRTILLTTLDYLRQLEAARRIQSADAVMEVVAQLAATLRCGVCGYITILKSGMRCVRCLKRPMAGPTRGRRGRSSGSASSTLGIPPLGRAA